MKTKLLAGFFVVFAVFTAFLATPAFGQGNISVLFDGTALVGNPKFLPDSDLNQMKAKNAVFPGVEVRFNQKGRVTLGVSYQKINLKSGPEHKTMIAFEDLEDPSSKAYESWDQAAEASANAVLATVYVNLTTRGKVRPFVGFGGGLAQFDKVSREYNYHVDIASMPDEYIQDMLKYNPGLTLHDLEFPPDITAKESAKQVLIKGIAGLNLYPAKHIVISLGGGYINGPALSFGAGFTF